LETIHRLIGILRDMVAFIREEQMTMVTIAERSDVSYSGLVRNIKLTNTGLDRQYYCEKIANQRWKQSALYQGAFGIGA
jgi:hypothetical protein